MTENTPHNLLYDNAYRIPSARKVDHAYDGGAYFVTICTKDRECYLGDIDGEMHLSSIGEYAEKMIQEICLHNVYAHVPCWVIMPNHIHLIVIIDNDKIPYERRGNKNTNSPRRDVSCNISTTGAMNDSLECRDVACRVSTTGAMNDSLECRDVACRVSTTGAMNDNLECRDVACRVSTIDDKNEYMQSIAGMQGWLSVVVCGFKSAVTKYAHDKDITFEWQTRFHDHIIRDHDEMNKIANYIETNVANWNNDCFHT